jgi:integrase
LGYYLALRPREMCHARWTWIEPAGDHWEMRVCRRPDEGFDPKRYSGWVPIADDVHEELLRLRRDLDPYILPGGNKTNREKLVNRALAVWMRDQGWIRQHCAHELRAYRGQVWRDTYGLDVARDWLRHRDARTTQDHYTVNHNRSKPAIGMAG